MCNGTAARGQVVQLIDNRKIPVAISVEVCYRVVLSDGVHFLQGMVARQLHDVMKDLTVNAIIRLDWWTPVRDVHRRMMIFVKGLSVVHRRPPQCGSCAQQPSGSDADDNEVVGMAEPEDPAAKLRELELLRCARCYPGMDPLDEAAPPLPSLPVPPPSRRGSV